ncbi:MAG: hypothetical protein J0H88_08380 [Sphingomonadales bacterium]|nr:hypothetical protein [Sphingomonadales bacterium]
MTKRTAVKLVADGSEFAQTADREIRSLRQKFAEAGKGLANEFPTEFAKGIKQAEAQVRGFADEFSRLSKGANLTGGLLSFDRGNINAELASARQYLMTQQQLATAIERVAAEEGQAGVAARARIAAQTIEIQKTEEMVRAIEQEIALMNRLQAELGETAQQQRRVTVVSGEQRAGMQQLSFQLADIASGWAAGVPPMQIFVQQSTQVVQAMQMMTNKSTGLIGFLSGPWGLAFTAAAVVVGGLVSKLWDSNQAMQAVEVTSDNLGQAQAALSKMFDLSTGKIVNNTQALRDNMYAQMIAAQANAASSRREAFSALKDAGASPTTFWERAYGRANTFANLGLVGSYWAERQIQKRDASGRNYEALIRKVAAGYSLEKAGAELDMRSMGEEQYYAVQNALNRANDSYTAGQSALDLRAGLGGKLPDRYLAPKKDRGGGGKRDRGGPDPAKIAESMASKLDEAYEKAVQLRGQFDQMPSDIDRSNNALIDAQQLIAQAQKTLADPKATAENRKRAQDVLKVAKEAAALAGAAPGKVLRDQLAIMDQTAQSQQLIAQGRMAEYNILQDNVELARILGAENVSQLDTMIAQRNITKAELEDYYKKRQQARLITIEIQRQQEEQQRLIGYIDDAQNVAKQGIYDFYSGKGLNVAKSAIKSLMDIQRRIMTEEAFKVIFGDQFEQQKLKILGLDQVDEAGRRQATAIERTIPPIDRLGQAAASVAIRLNSLAANDNPFRSVSQNSADDIERGQPIIVNGTRAASTPSPETKQLLTGFTESLQMVMRGAAYGQASSGVLRSLGLKQSNLGAQIGGAIGMAAFGPLGGFVGGALGGTIGGLFKKTPKGSATVTSISENAAYSGSKSLRQSVSGLGSNVQDTLAQIADALGGEANSFSVSIGQRKKKYTVDPTGKGRTKGSGVLTFASEEEAIMAAVRDALSDGAIRGISAAAQRILQSGGDLQKAIEKASMIESIPNLLKSRLNPLGAALDDLNEKWDKTIAALKEGAATAEQMADAEKLYQLERDEIMKAANDNLREFINGLNFGPSSALSLRDQETNARANLQPYLDAINRGDIAGIDRDKYLAAADSFLQISRSLNGSTSGYFANVDELRTATQALLDQSESQSKAAEARDPFVEATAKNTADIAAILNNQTGLLMQIVNGGGIVIGDDSGFIGNPRSFVRLV